MALWVHVCLDLCRACTGPVTRPRTALLANQLLARMAQRLFASPALAGTPCEGGQLADETGSSGPSRLDNIGIKKSGIRECKSTGDKGDPSCESFEFGSNGLTKNAWPTSVTKGALSRH